MGKKVPKVPEHPSGLPQFCRAIRKFCEATGVHRSELCVGMIHEVSGDILLTDAEALAHGISPNDHFDTGLALSLRQDWPALYKDFRHYVHTTHPKPGGLWVWQGTDGRRIVNLFTQEGGSGDNARPGRATISNVNHCLRELQHWVTKEGIRTLALPGLSTGVGGLEWAQVDPLVRAALGSLPVDIFVYTTFKKGVKAAEKRGHA